MTTLERHFFRPEFFVESFRKFVVTIMSSEKAHKPWVDGVAGGLSSMLTKTLMTPIQRVVVMKQLGEHKGMSSLALVKMIKANEGYKGFFAGNLTTLLQRFPYSGIQLIVYGKVKFVLQDMLPDDQQGGSQMFQKFVVKCGAGGIAAIVSGAAVYPADVVKTRLQSGDPRYRHITTTIREVWRETNGPRNFYSGLRASLTQRVPDILINYGVYETVKFELEEKFGTDPTIATMAGGASAAAVAVLCTFPLDVCKRRMAMSGQGKSGKVYNSIGHCMREMYKEGGVVGMYSGAGLEAARCVPQVVMMWLLIEKLRAALNSL